MSTIRRHARNASRPDSGGQKPCNGDTSEPRSHSIPQSEQDPSSAQLQQELDHAKGNYVDDKDNDEVSAIYGPGPSMNHSKQLPAEQKINPQATTTHLSPTPPMTSLLAGPNSTPPAVKPSAVWSQCLRKRSDKKTKDEPMDIIMQQTQVETALPSQHRCAQLLFGIVQTFLGIFRSPFLVPLCFVLALWYLISSLRAGLAEIVDTVQSAGTVIGSYFSFTWQYPDAWTRSLWNNAAPSLYQIVTTGADVTVGALNKTSVAVCSHYFGWLILTNLGLDCPFSVPYHPLDSNVSSTLNSTALGLSEIADIAVELFPFGRQLTYSELWLRQASFTILASDMSDKVELATYYEQYTNQIADVGEEVTAFVHGTDAHLDFQKFNLRFLRIQIGEDNERIWWHKLFLPRQSVIRREYLDYIHASDKSLMELFEHGSKCVDFIRACQSTNGRIQVKLQRNTDEISSKVDQRGIFSRWLGRNEDLTRETDRIGNMEEYLPPLLDLLGSILDRVRRIRGELSTLEAALKNGYVGVTPARLMVQLQIISASIERLHSAREDLRQGERKEKALFEQQFRKDKTLMYKPLYQEQSHTLTS
ncbi:hypothetical protein GJ744_010845 [Endocarpon pusillum]|uniref:Uncharacterized protein n=1 Tax=Endocarpon pusillum TaxID=364733 RepID=A0A8H7E3V2_9EURO|nr:hypothetical protein GJ744_010845 [Endocarpon pusillum]